MGPGAKPRYGFGRPLGVGELEIRGVLSGGLENGSPQWVQGRSPGMGLGDAVLQK